MSDDIHGDTYWFSVFHSRGESQAQIRSPISPWPEVTWPSSVQAWVESWLVWLPSDSEVCDPLWGFGLNKMCVYNLSRRGVLLLPWTPKEKPLQETLFIVANRRLPVTEWNNEEAETKQHSAVAVVVNQWRFQPHFWHTLNLVSLFALDPSRLATLDKEQETKTVI